ncbi:Retrovirus-related Pol polyprotein from transposon TNT 1-94 [Cucumis melo var. makuwa]|uniref:Retrovirus-related Pol polyprotein from transposon TNT 1-94 n=1 Tax=Cucumis melo var. makuwa TaxID=1194695 RepID=A0A5A7TAK1_CUCMM|nr:Retrovirus-related Pol polyprotein from transposon TNT 1-94 [Cucumis melo var. makuwa]
MSENDKFDVAIENVEKKNSGDETEVRTETNNNEAEQDHIGKLDKYDPSLDLPIVLRKECPEWKNAVMEEMEALEKNNFWEICALPKGHKSVGCKWVFTLKYRADGTLDRHKVSHAEHGLTDSLPLSSPKEISQLKQRMGNEFEIKDLGNLKYFLGMEVARSKEGISVSQRNYTLDLTEIGMLGCHPVDSPIEFNCKLGNSVDQVPVDKEQYQRLVGKLIYLSHTRPDIFFATDRKTNETYTDSDRIGSVVDRKSTSGYCTFVWGNLVTWRSEKQSIAVRSSVEAEYRAMNLGICEEIWLQKVLSDLHQKCETPLKLFCDNKAAISFANNPVQHDRSKHVEIDRH